MRYQIKPFSPFKNMVQGMFSSSLLEYDVTKRKYKKNTYDYSEDFKKARHLVDAPIVSSETDFISLSALNPDAFPSFTTTAHWVQDVNEIAQFSNNSTNSGREYILRRKSQMQQINQMGVELELPGNPIIAIGQVVYFGRAELDFSGQKSETWLRNPFMAGKFLITRKTTILENSTQNNSHGFSLKTVLSLRKDSDVGTQTIGSEEDV